MARSENKVIAADLNAGSKFEYDGHKYRVVENIELNGTMFVYVANSLFPMEFYPDSEINLISA